MTTLDSSGRKVRNLPARELLSAAPVTTGGALGVVTVVVPLRHDDGATSLALGAEAEPIPREAWRGTLFGATTITAGAHVVGAASGGSVVRIKWRADNGETPADFSPACEVPVDSTGTYVGAPCTIPAGAGTLPTVILTWHTQGGGTLNVGNVWANVTFGNASTCNSTLTGLAAASDDFCRYETAAQFVAAVGANGSPVAPYSGLGLVYGTQVSNAPINFEFILDHPYNGGHHAVRQHQRATSATPGNDLIYATNDAPAADAGASVVLRAAFSTGYQAQSYVRLVQLYGSSVGAALMVDAGGETGHAQHLVLSVTTAPGVIEYHDLGAFSTYADTTVWEFRVHVTDNADGTWSATAHAGDPFSALGGGLLTVTKPNYSGAFAADIYYLLEGAQTAAPAADQFYDWLEWEYIADDVI